MTEPTQIRAFTPEYVIWLRAWLALRILKVPKRS